MILLDVGIFFRIALDENLSSLAGQSKDVGNRPRNIQGLDVKDVNLDELMIILSKHALPFIISMTCFIAS